MLIIDHLTLYVYMKFWNRTQHIMEINSFRCKSSCSQKAKKFDSNWFKVDRKLQQTSPRYSDKNKHSVHKHQRDRENVWITHIQVFAAKVNQFSLLFVYPDWLRRCIKLWLMNAARRINNVLLIVQFWDQLGDQWLAGVASTKINPPAACRRVYFFLKRQWWYCGCVCAHATVTNDCDKIHNAHTRSLSNSPPT